MPVEFNDYFWGEKNNGFDVLYHNMKFGLVASKELSEFFREKSNIEEQNSKLMSKLAHKASTGTLNSTFAPVWTILRTSAEKLSTLHLQMVQKLSELVKDVAKYADELHKKHKSVKEDESHTQECMQSMQASTASVLKSRDLYASKVLELEKLRKENASQKDIEKLETKLKKLQEDYRTLLDKHNPIKIEFEKRMTQSCRRFQDIEEMHLRQMKEFLSTYLELVQNNHDMVGQVHSDFKRQFLDMTIDKLLEQFVLNKYTGLEKPEVPELEYVPLSIQQKSLSATRLNQTVATTPSMDSAANSNSAISIPGAATRAGIEVASLGSGSDSLFNADDNILGIITSPRATSPALHKTATTTAANTVAQSAAAASYGTSTTTAIATTATTTTTSSVKSNFFNWFGKQQQQQSNAQAATATGTANTVAATSNATATASAAATSSGTNFGMESNESNTAFNVVINNSLNNSELQSSLQDNNNQGSFMSSALTQLSEQQFTITKSTSNSTTTTTTTTNNINDTNLITSFANANSTTVSATTTTTTTNTNTNNNSSTSSSIPMSGILRSRREKTKAKKSKKKKDGESTENIQEERLGSIERSNALEQQDDLLSKMKTQTSSGSSAGLAMSSASAPGSVDSTTAAAAGILAGTVAAANSAQFAGSSNGNNGISASAAVAIGSAIVSGQQSTEVDEDGYSIQPAKELAWEEKRDNVGSFYSDSDSDSDNDKPERRIHVKIQPIKNGQAPMSASVDELRATMENISLSPTGVFSHSQQLQQSRIASRTQSPEISNASTPTALMHPYAPLQSPTLSMSNRYADLGDIFSEPGDVSASAPASATLSKSQTRQIPTPTSAGSIAIPRPPSRRSEMVAQLTGGRGRNSPAQMNRADSIGSLEYRSTMAGMATSRGPSPLTIGISDTIPLAVAFHEIIHAYFRGSDESRCQVKISGDMMLSFPAGIAGLLANNPNPAKLGFRIKNVHNLENLLPNNKLVQIDKYQSNSFSTMLEFNMPMLTALLRRQAEQNPNAPYFNVDILKYQVRTKPGASSCPFQLVSYWKCDPASTAIKIDYKYNNHAMASASPLLNVTLSVPVNGSVRNVQSKPHSAWLGESNRLVWNFTDISQNSTDAGIGTLRARLELNDGPSNPAILSTHFNCEGTTLSGIEFELQGSGYRLSLVKRRFVSGKYICEGDGIRTGTTPTPTSVGSTSPYSAKSN